MPAKIPWFRPPRAPAYLKQLAREQARRKAQASDIARRKAQASDTAPTTLPGRKTPFPSDRRWRRFRGVFLAAHPLSEDCEAKGYATPATEVHHEHKRSLDVDGEHWFDPEHCRALCKSCHSIRTGRGE
jgi:5-methylcytosine-specific restriction endonuclease McrA